MNETPLPRPPQYTKQELIERRSAKNNTRFRLYVGAMAVMGGIGVASIAAGGGRPLVHDIERAVSNRVAMVKDAFGSDSINNHTSPQIKRLSHDIGAQKAQNQAPEAQAQADQLAVASAASADAGVIEMSQGQ